MRLRHLASVATLVALTCAAHAAADSGIPTGTPQAGPTLAGPTAIWAGPELHGGGFAIESGRPGGRAARLTTVRPPPDFSSLSPSLAASPERVVVSYGLGDAETQWESRGVLTAPVGGSFESLTQGCGGGGQPDLPRVVDVSENLVAYPRCDGIFVRDYSSPVAVDERLPNDSLPWGLRVAGRYVTWLDGAHGDFYNKVDIVVYDRVLHKIVYRVSREAIGGDLHDLDLQADGKVAFSFTTADRMKVAWVAPSAPTPHVLPLPAQQFYEVRMAGDRVAYEGGFVPYSNSSSRSEIGISDLAGHSRTLGHDGVGSLFTDDFDFDGARLAWWSYGCTTAVIHVVDAAGPGQKPRSGCRLRFRRPARVGSGGNVHLFANCFGFEASSCSLEHVILAKGRKKHAVVLGRGENARHVTLTSLARSVLADRKRLAVRVQAVVTDFAGRREHRSGKAVLRIK